MFNVEEYLKKASQELDDLEEFIKNNPNLEQQMRKSMATTFGTILATETMDHPLILEYTDFITNLTVMATIYGYRKALQDNPIIGKEVK